MKHKGMTVLFVLVTFAATPPVWQKLGNFLSAVQHRAQVKFLSMVLSSGADEAETLNVPTVLNKDVASCAGPATGEMPDAVAAQSKSSFRRIKSERRNSTTPEEPNTVALKHASRDDSLAHLIELLPQSQNRLTMHAIAAIPKELAIDENDILEFAVSPQKDSFAPAVIGSSNTPLKVRRVVEVNKASRPRIRNLISRPLFAPAASKADAASSEREG